MTKYIKIFDLTYTIIKCIMTIIHQGGGRIVIDFSNLKLNNKMPVYIQITQFVKKEILLNNLQSGDILPSRRELAATLEINPNTAQKAFRLMEKEGYVITSGNEGSKIHLTTDSLNNIENELTKEMVKTFILSAKDIHLEYPQVIRLLKDMWDEV
ncbi:GntR family transcriptional regulator [Natranaerovirga hydrolytica]|uniref:GntR family transcriptional regulator n=1 Tax=Natranaerovirga hydrolytica TaxID=680378 RepID=A0A4R1N0V4_9FIRM|nr:GntR family transcriptional regulator [Natranaerovirga hydrolytica]